MTDSADILELLLPEVPADRRARVRQLTTALRLGVHAGKGVRVADVAWNVDKAREELSEVGRRRRVRALTALLHHHLATHLDPAAFLPWGAAPAELEAAWRTLLEDGAPAVRLPAPGEQAIEVAVRLFAALGRPEADGPEGTQVVIWGMRMCRALEGADAATRAARELAGADHPHAVRRAAVAAVAANLLTVGAVGEARAWLASHADLAAADDELAWYLAWCELAAGDEDAARATARGLDAYRGVLPRSLAALRSARPEWLALLPGREPEPPRSASVDPVPTDAESARRSVGGSVLAVFALGPAHEAVLIDQDTGPALRDRVHAWAEGRDGAPADHAAPEHLVVAGAETLVRHVAGVGLRGVLDPKTRAHAMVPVRFGHGTLEGEVAGWVALEFPHHLVPAPDALQRLADGWRGRVLATAWSRRGVAAEAVPAPTTGETALDAADPRAVAVRAWIDEQRLKVRRRRWWFFDVEGTTRSLVASGGGALLGEVDGRAHAVARAIATGGAIAFDEPDPRLAMRAEAASGVALPVRGPRGVIGVLVIESDRRRDFPARDRGRWIRRLRAFHDRWLVARFSAWHVRMRGHGVHVDPAEAYPMAPAEALAAGRARMPVAVVGRPGSGRRVTARWLALEGGGADVDPLEVDLRVRGLPAHASRRRAWIVSGLDAATPDRQVETIETLDPARTRMIAVLPAPPADLAGLAPDVATPLGRLVHHVPALAERRNAIPGLCRHLLDRVASEEAIEPVTLTDRALGLLWRQPWPGQVAELERVLARLALHHADAEIDGDEVLAAAEALGIQLRRKIPSRHPERRDVVAALEVTRCGTGALNKTRAAAYLGWDPDTLVARMRDHGLAVD